MSDDELARLRARAKDDRKLIRRAADALAQIDRADGLGDEHADVLAALRIRLEGRSRASLEDLLTAAGDIGSSKGEDAFTREPDSSSEWPEVRDDKKQWPGL